MVSVDNAIFIHAIVPRHVETVVQLVRKKPDTYIDITVDMDELDLTSSEAKATYDEIKDYIFDKHCSGKAKARYYRKRLLQQF